MCDTPRKSARKQILPSDSYKTPNKKQSRHKRLGTIENLSSTDDEPDQHQATTTTTRKSGRKISPSKRYNENEFTLELPGDKRKQTSNQDDRRNATFVFSDSDEEDEEPKVTNYQVEKENQFFEDDLEKIKIALEVKTPRHVRNKVKTQIAKLLEDSSNSEFSAEYSDFHPSPDSSSASSAEIDDDHPLGN